MTTSFDFSKLVQDITYRSQVLSTLEKNDRIVVSTNLEAYERLISQRAKLVSKTYASKQKQVEDQKLKDMQSALRLKIVEAFSK
jgi:hypothetical protein